MKLPKLPNVDLNVLKNIIGKVDKLELSKKDIRKNDIGQIIIVTGNENVIINQPINEKTQAVPFTESLKEIEKEGYDAGEYFFSRRDNIPFIAETRITPEEYDKIIEEVKPYIPSRDVGALRYAALICNLEDEGRQEKELEKIRCLLYHYYSREGTESFKDYVGSHRGATIYNWLRCGAIFLEDVIPHVKLCMNLTKGDMKLFNEIFLPFWESLIEFHPTRIFVSRTMQADELYTEMYERLIYREKTDIQIYTRTPRLSALARKTIKRFIKDHPQYKFSEVPYTIGTTQAKNFNVAKL